MGWLEGVEGLYDTVASRTVNQNAQITQTHFPHGGDDATNTIFNKYISLLGFLYSSLCCIILKFYIRRTDEIWYIATNTQSCAQRAPRPATVLRTVPFSTFFVFWSNGLYSSLTDRTIQCKGQFTLKIELTSLLLSLSVTPPEGCWKLDSRLKRRNFEKRKAFCGADGRMLACILRRCIRRCNGSGSGCG